MLLPCCRCCLITSIVLSIKRAKKKFLCQIQNFYNNLNRLNKMCCREGKSDEKINDAILQHLQGPRKILRLEHTYKFY
jgi:hypothetical protein